MTSQIIAIVLLSIAVVILFVQYLEKREDRNKWRDDYFNLATAHKNLATDHTSLQRDYDMEKQISLGRFNDNVNLTAQLKKFTEQGQLGAQPADIIEPGTDPSLSYPDLNHNIQAQC